MSRIHALFRFSMAGLAILGVAASAAAQMEDTNRRSADEGDGPHDRLILRGGIYIDGAGSPPLGPVDIVIENDRIVQIQAVGFPMASLVFPLRWVDTVAVGRPISSGVLGLRSICVTGLVLGSVLVSSLTSFIALTLG